MAEQRDFFIPAILLSLSVHGLLIGAGGRIPSLPQFSVVDAPNSLEVTVIYQPVVSIIEEEIVSQVITEEVNPQEMSVSAQVQGALVESDPQLAVSSRKSQGAVTKAKPLVHINPAPSYPRLARKRGWEGKVRISVFVEKDGTPTQVDVQESSGHEVLDSAAVTTVQRWKFLPAQSGSTRLSSRVTIPIQFRLKKK